MTDTNNRYKCYLHYSDGLTKKLELNYFDLEETWNVWLGEIDEHELVYLKIRALPNTSEEM